MVRNIRYSLAGLLGTEYIESVIAARTFLTGETVEELRRIAYDEVDFYPGEFAANAERLAALTGQTVCPPFADGNSGAATDSFAKAQHSGMAPLAALGCTRIGEDGRAYFIGKSEHYHASLGHSFPGYRLLNHAALLGIPNATHNNTRGYITRLAECEIVRTANGGSAPDPADERTLDRVINLETGSLAVEAGLKMMLARFYRLDATYPEPRYHGRIPVFLVMADLSGGCQANYHGTTVLTQVLRGMWPDFAAGLGEQLFRVVPVPVNDAAAFDEIIRRHDDGETKIAGFFHELVLMNYGGVKLDEAFVRHAHAVCLEHDIPTMVDEIQSCMWCPEQFLFRHYGLRPDFVSVGKGFPGGQYPASRILTNRKMDSLNQFGALVTNGQEELASLAYLITMRFAAANAAHIRETGDYYHTEARKFAAAYPKLLDRIEGFGLMTTLVFHSADVAARFAKQVTAAGIDVSAQTYKAECPPAALTKLPLIASRNMAGMVLERMRAILEDMSC